MTGEHTGIPSYILNLGSRWRKHTGLPSHIPNLGTRCRKEITTTAWWAGWIPKSLQMVERKLPITALRVVQAAVCHHHGSVAVFAYSMIHLVSDGDRYYFPLFLWGLRTEWWSQSTILHEQRTYGESPHGFELPDVYLFLSRHDCLPKIYLHLFYKINNYN